MERSSSDTINESVLNIFSKPRNSSRRVKTEDCLVNSIFLLRLSCGLAGLQTVWSVILSKGTPFLVSLGFSKSLTALIWIAAPLAGTFIQPIVGAYSDQSRIPWGRRRPFIIAGAITTACSITTLGFVENLVHRIGWSFHGAAKFDEDITFKTTTIAAAILVCCLYASIQPVQVGMRCLIVENVPPSQLTQANAWATYVTGGGNIVGLFLGSIDILHVLGLKAMSEFQVLALLSSTALLVTTTVSCASVDEQSLTMDFNWHKRRNIMASLLSAIGTLPGRIRDVYRIQFFAWVGWFPLLYYKSTYISELYSTSKMLSNPSLSQEQLQNLHRDASKVGTAADLWFAGVSLTANICLSLLFRRSKIVGTFTPHCSMSINIANLWLTGHITFILIISIATVVTTATQASFFLALAGISWALTQWIPYVILGEEIANQTHLQGCETNKALMVEAGTIMSLHNAAISLPQILSAVACSGVFEMASGFGKANATAWAMRIAELGTILATYCTYRSNL